MSGLKILYNLILKDAVKGSGSASGILSIGKDIRKLADKKFQRYVMTAQKQGVDLDSLSEQEIKYMLELNKPKAPQVFSNEEAYAFLNRFLNQGKKGEVIRGKFKPLVTVDSVITDIKKLKPIESMKETNRVLRGEGKYKNLSKADREKIAGDESVTDHIFERNIIDETEDFAYGGVAGLLGERPGYQLGKIVYDPLFNQKTQLPPSQGLGIGEVPSRINREYTDATQQAYNIGNIAAKTGITSPTALVNLSQNPVAANMMRSMNLMRTDSPKTKTGFEEQGLSSDYRHALGTSAFKDSIIDYLGSNLGIDKSSGILDAIGSAVAKGATVFEEGKDALSQIKAYNTQYPGEYKVDGLADYDFIPSKPTLSFEEILAQPKEDFTANFFAADQIPFGMKPVTKMEMIDAYRKFGPKLFMKQLQNKKKQDFQNIVKAAEEKKAADAAEKARLERLGKDKNRGGFDPSGPTQKSIRRDRADKSGKGHSGGFTNPGKGSYGPHMASGGIARQNFAMGRRAFLKLLGGVGAGIGALKTGAFKLLGKEAAPVAEEVVKSVGSGTKPPSYFFNLVNKIKTLGDEVTPKYATQERQRVTKYKDFELTEDIATGEKTIQKKSFADIEEGFSPGNKTEEVYMNYKPGKGQMDETTKGKTPPDEYTEDTTTIGASGGQRGEIIDTVDGVPDEVVQEGTMFKDKIKTDFSKENFKKSMKKFKKIDKTIEEGDGYTKIEKITDKIQNKASGGLAHMLGE
jgi:hypothetical protein